MSTLKFSLVLALSWGVYDFWQKHQTAAFLEKAMQTVSKNGFVEVPQPSEGDPSEVMIFAAVNCPSDAAKRADELSRQLSTRGIPNFRLDNVNFETTEQGNKDFAVLSKIMMGTAPVVFVGGKAKANPTLDEVVNEYRNING